MYSSVYGRKIPLAPIIIEICLLKAKPMKVKKIDVKTDNNKEVRKTESACFLSFLPTETANIDDPPILRRALTAPISIIKGYATLIAPSASLPIPLPTKIPSTMVKRKMLRLLSRVGKTNLITFFRRLFIYCSLAGKYTFILIVFHFIVNSLLFPLISRLK